MFESIRDAVVVAEAATGQIVLWNPAATEIFGDSPTKALELRIDDLVPKCLKAQHRAGLDRYRETGHGPYVDSGVLLDLPAVHKTGEEIRIAISTLPLARSTARQPAGVSRSLSSATPPSASGSKIGFARAKGGSAPLSRTRWISLMVTESDGTIRYISPSVERTLGYQS